MKKVVFFALAASILFAQPQYSSAAGKDNGKEHGKRHPYGNDMVCPPGLSPDHDSSVVRIQPVGKERIINLETEDHGLLRFVETRGKLLRVIDEDGQELVLVPKKVKKKKKNSKSEY